MKTSMSEKEHYLIRGTNFHIYSNRPIVLVDDIRSVESTTEVLSCHENFWTGQACPQSELASNKTFHGFDGVILFSTSNLKTDKNHHIEPQPEKLGDENQTNCIQTLFVEQSKRETITGYSKPSNCCHDENNDRKLHRFKFDDS